MNNGEGQEFDHPYKLLVNEVGDSEITNTDGYFANMLKATGESTSMSLFDIAKQKFDATQ